MSAVATAAAKQIKKMVSLVAKIIHMSKFLGSRSNVWHL
jgi:hypothetical protein